MQGVKGEQVEKKTIAVTGASGFIGRYLLDLLRTDENISVAALTRSNAAHDVGDRNIKWLQTDYSFDSLKDVLCGTDVVIHLAGTKGFKTDPADFETDLEMMKNILEAMAADKVKRIVYASSRMAYGDPGRIPWKEEYALKAETAYGITKARCEKMCSEYAEKYGFDTVAVRIAQVLGKGEGTKTMINVFQALAKEGRELTVIGKSVARRQYIYTKDLAAILKKLALMEDAPEVVNAGMIKAYTNYEIACLINQAYKNKTPVNYKDEEPETIKSSIMDVSTMIKRLEYIPMDMRQAMEDMAAE